jgi:hypothetical protein
MSAGYDLDMSVSARTWTRDHPIYCPVPWCNAHKLRVSLCGDADGEYEGIHVARIRYVARWAKLEAKRAKAYADLGCDHLTWRTRVQQDSIDMGLERGRKGRRNV